MLGLYAFSLFLEHFPEYEEKKKKNPPPLLKISISVLLPE